MISHVTDEFLNLHLKGAQPPTLTAAATAAP
jgi:hypothetical protein